MERFLSCIQTGGLADTVREYNPVSGLGEGFSFLHYNADDMAYAVRRALEIYGFGTKLVDSP